MGGIEEFPLPTCNIRHKEGQAENVSSLPVNHLSVSDHPHPSLAECDGPALFLYV